MSSVAVMVKRVFLWAALGGILIAILEIVEYKHFVREYSSGICGGLVALIFTVVGVSVGLRWTRAKRVIVKEVLVRADGPFVLNEHNFLRRWGSIGGCRRCSAGKSSA